MGEEAGLDTQIQDLNMCLTLTKEKKKKKKRTKILPELFKIGGCIEQKSELRLWDALVTTGKKKKKCFLKSQLYLKAFIYLGILGKHTAI